MFIYFVTGNAVFAGEHRLLECVTERLGMNMQYN